MSEETVVKRRSLIEDTEDEDEIKVRDEVLETSKEGTGVIWPQGKKSKLATATAGIKSTTYKRPQLTIPRFFYIG